MTESFICGGIFDLERKEDEVLALEAQMAEPSFWNDQKEAQKIINTCNKLKEWTLPYRDLKKCFSEVQDLLPEAFECGDKEFCEELILELDKVDTGLTRLEVKKMLSSELDDKSCFLEINSGAGGTEACDWALMLSRMYQRWASKKGWQVQVMDMVEGDVAGIKSITLKFDGSFAYGYAKAEKGVHRLVRISPFDANAKRHTSFASVDVTPQIEDDINIEIRSEDVRIDTYRASGAGGQHVNKTDSAVRITHIPTGIVVSCQQERSQLQNKETCYKMLKSKLYEKEVLERQNHISSLGGEKKEIAWGSQIRNYVFQPYTLVKDTRTGYEAGNIDSMMDGELLDDFIEAYLKEFGSANG
jgi:peptide chain release factor 2